MSVLLKSLWFNCTLCKNGSIWWMLWCLEVWGGGRRMRGAGFLCGFLCVITCKSATNLQHVANHNRSCYTNVNSQWSEDRKKKKNWEAQKRQECRKTSRFLPLKEMKTRGAASGSLRMGFPRVKLDRARRVWTVHRPSSCIFDRPPASQGLILSNLCGDNRWIWVSLLNVWMRSFSLRFYGMNHDFWLSRAPSARILVITLRYWRASQTTVMSLLQKLSEMS